MISVEFKKGKGVKNEICAFGEPHTYQVEKGTLKFTLTKYDFDSNKIMEKEYHDKVYNNVEGIFSVNKDKLLRAIFKMSPLDPPMYKALFNIKYILLLNPELKNYSYKSSEKIYEVSFKFDCQDEFITRDILE